MKRLGRVRECDAKYLSGRPSFTGASWGDTLNLKSGISAIGIVSLTVTPLLKHGITLALVWIDSACA